ncbi:hypothetical protein PPERSA_11680 [Pseudocohnilembus persalinus]|uniref:RING-type domain-containing protein n=1 Tax=Pseudocohnilembus persalinus TaxID=266149 RepID=A0A0V0R146_PSEPJ|nr:hypothetical protein PPERSA_11680 [Pseudocohnilembus persalinus]|eukprot:KRX08203.1 hypothetical protein PPERSA_11680 [Pseudocohnilembus persalinus]
MTNDSLQQYYLDFEEYQQQLIQEYPQIQFDSDTSTFDNEHENLQTLKQEEIQFQQKILFAIKMEDNKYQYKQIYNYKCELLQNQLLIAFICPVQEESQEPGWLFITYKELIFAKNQDKNETYIDFALYFEVLENNIGKKVQNQQRIEYNKYSQYKFMPYFKKSGKVMDQFYNKMEAKDIKYTPLMAITEFKNQMDFFVVFQKYDLKQSTIYLLLCSFETKQLKTYPIKIDNSQLFFQNFSVLSIQVIPNNIRDQNSQLYSKEQIKNFVQSWIKNQPLYNIAHNVEEQQCEYSCKQKNTQIDYEFKSPYCIESDKIDLFENHCYDLQNCQLCQLQAHCSWIEGICTPQNNYNYQKIKEAQNYFLEQDNVFKKKIPAQYQQNYDQYANLQVCDVPSYCPKKNKVIKGRKNKIFLKNYSNKDMIFEDKLVNKYFSKKNIENDLVNIQKYNYCYWDIQTGKLDSYIFIINFGVGFLPQMYNETYYAKLSFCFDDQLHQNSDCSSFETKIIRLENNRTKPIYYSDKFKNVKIYIDFLQDIQINPKFFYISYWPSLLNAQYSLISALLVCLCIIVILFLILFLIKTCLITYFNTYFQEIQYAASRELTDQQVAKLLQNLKKKKVVEIKRYDIQNSAQMFNQQECPICYEEFENDKEIVELFCKHILCVQCFKSLLKYNMTEQCPNCKQQYSKATEIRKQIEQKTKNNRKVNQSIQDANYPLVMQNQNQEDLNTTQNFSIEMVQQQENQN